MSLAGSMRSRWYTATPANDGTGRVLIERYRSPALSVFLGSEDARALRDEIDAALGETSAPTMRASLADKVILERTENARAHEPWKGRYWKAGSDGYTNDITLAGLFDAASAKNLTDYDNARSRAIPAYEALACERLDLEEKNARLNALLT